jgi:hypothetical protein
MPCACYLEHLYERHSEVQIGQVASVECQGSEQPNWQHSGGKEAGAHRFPGLPDAQHLQASRGRWGANLQPANLQPACLPATAPLADKRWAAHPAAEEGGNRAEAHSQPGEGKRVGEAVRNEVSIQHYQCRRHSHPCQAGKDGKQDLQQRWRQGVGAVAAGWRVEGVSKRACTDTHSRSKQSKPVGFTGGCGRLLRPPGLGKGHCSVQGLRSEPSRPPHLFRQRLKTFRRSHAGDSAGNFPKLESRPHRWRQRGARSRHNIAATDAAAALAACCVRSSSSSTSTGTAFPLMPGVRPTSHRRALSEASAARRLPPPAHLPPPSAHAWVGIAAQG